MYTPQYQACYSGRELWNMCRVLTYANGQIPGLIVTTGDGSNSCCDCQCCDEVFTDPATDDVCWYDVNYPESGEFLGFLPTSIGGLATGATIRNNRSTRYGDLLTRRRVRGREIRITGWLMGTSRRGLEWGYRWMAQTLKRDDGCLGGEYSFYNGCDTSGDPDVMTDDWTIKRVGLIEGPNVLSESQDFPSPCYLREIEFTFHAEHPWLWKQPTGVLANISTDTGCDPTTRVYSWSVDGPPPGFVSTTQILIRNKTSCDSTYPIFITGAPSSWMGPTSAGCPPDRTQRPPMGMGLVLRAGENVLIDGSTRLILKANDAGCPIGLATNVGLMDGAQYLFPEIEPCESWCFGVWMQDNLGDDTGFPEVAISTIMRADG